MTTAAARCFTGPLAMRLAAAAISLSSVIDASPTPSTSRSRASGAWITSANEPNVSISVLASGLTSRRGNGAEQHQFEQFVIAQRVGAGLRKRSRSRSRWP